MLSKNIKKEKAKLNRAFFDMNTGTRIHKDKRFESRQKVRENLKNYLTK